MQMSTLPGNFVHKPTTTQRQAYEALLNAKQETNADIASRVCAAVIAEDYEASFARVYGITRSKGTWCIQRLLGKRCQMGRMWTSCACRPPADDHPTLWNHQGKPVFWVSQPYGLAGAHVREIVAFCETHGLDFWIDAWPGWHFPGHVLTVIYSRPGMRLQLWEAVRQTRTTLPQAVG